MLSLGYANPINVTFFLLEKSTKAEIAKTIRKIVPKYIFELDLLILIYQSLFGEWVQLSKQSPIDSAQRPRLAAGLVFEKRRARLLYLFKSSVSSP